MSTIRKLNKIPTVLQKIDPMMLDLKKKNADLKISIHKLNKIIEELEKKNKRSRSIMKKMDCVIHVLSKDSSKNFCYLFILLLI